MFGLLWCAVAITTFMTMTTLMTMIAPATTATTMAATMVMTRGTLGMLFGPVAFSKIGRMFFGTAGLCPQIKEQKAASLTDQSQQASYKCTKKAFRDSVSHRVLSLPG